jgi:hypothetical protein
MGGLQSSGVLAQVVHFIIEDIVLVEVRLTEDKALGSEEKGNFLVNNISIRIQFVPHRKHITPPLQRPTG